MPESVNNKAVMDSQELDSSQRIIKAIVGGVVVILVILVAIGIINLVRSRFTPKPTVQPPPQNLVTNTLPANTPVVTNQNTDTTYSTMPETGPAEALMVVFGLAIVLGSATVVMSKRFF